MALISGASGFLSAATLAQKQGSVASVPTVLGHAAGGVDLLSAGKRLAPPGIGVSSAARSINQSFLNRTSEINAMLSLAAGEGTTIEGARQQILALRARLPESSLGQNFFEDV